ncbi:dicarboxylate/amino acid:cation symporter [Anoxybacillus flavithermus]|uniref:dicarboxylate/amino acid:cation symporter n=1 Tax=Anoxybacillus flavithermus TaxID=33934 RepID=UPI0039F552AB
MGFNINIENSKHPDKVEHVIKFFNGFSKIMFRLTKMVLKLTPYGVFGLIANVSAKYGLDTLLPLGSFIVTVYIACLVHLLFTYGGLVFLIGKINPFIFFKRVYPAMVVAFTSRSSYGTLPVTLEVIIQRLKVPEKIAHFVAPLGATINMDGCGGLYPAIVAVFVSSIYGIDLSITQYILIIAISTIATIGTAGVPGTASVMTTVVLSSVGLPVEGLALVIGVDAIVDMARTTVNVTGDTVVSLLVAKSEKELDEETFYNAKDLDLIKDI